MKTSTKIILDINKPSVEKVFAKQGDSQTRSILIEFLQGMSPWAVPVDIEMAVQYRKPDGTRGLYSELPNENPAVIIVETNVVEIVLAPQMLTVDGRVTASLAFSDTDGNVLQSFSFLVEVEKSEGHDLQSEDYYNVPTLAGVQESILRLLESDNRQDESIRRLHDGTGSTDVVSSSAERVALKNEVNSVVLYSEAQAVNAPITFMLGNNGDEPTILRGIATPQQGYDAAPKEYVDRAVQGSSQVYIQENEPEDAQDGTLWIDEDEEIEIPSGAVSSVNGKTGAVVLNAADVGAATKEDVSEAIANALSAIGVAEEGAY